MARSVPWRRVISDAASWHQDQALNSTIYILRQTGPTGFLLKEEGETKKFKVFLGDPHKCTCPVFVKEKDICKHISWILLKKFRVPRQNPITWQLGLVEREINEILQGILARQEARPNQTAKKYANIAAHMGHDLDGGQPVMQQREIGEDDVCPICQDELLAKHLPVTYCKFGCGNNVHIKCMKVWADHQKSSGKTTIECPFCREDFGPISLLQQEMKNSSERETRAERMNEHLGTTCRKCHVCPIKGKCYKCSVCADYHLCQVCFNTPVHLEHNFLFRQKFTQRWRPAANRSQGGLLPDAVLTNLMTRDISEQDYDLLLQLDNQSAQQLSDLTEETIQSFPMERIRQNGPLLAPGQQCRICLRGYEIGQFVRRLPCHHKFHRDCIDNWLLHRHPTCPVDGTVYSNESVRQMKEANMERLRQLRQNSSAQKEQNNNKNVRGFDTRRNRVLTNDDLDLEIPGIGIARLPSLNDNFANHSQNNQDRRVHNRSNGSTIQSEQFEGHLQGDGQRSRLFVNKGTSSSPSGSTGVGDSFLAINNHGSSSSSLMGLTVGEVIRINVGQPRNDATEDDIIDVIETTNRRYYNDRDLISDDLLSQVLGDLRSISSHSNRSVPNSGAMGSAGSGSQRSHLRRHSPAAENSVDDVGSASAVEQGQTFGNKNILFDPPQENSAKESFRQEIGLDNTNGRQNRLMRQQARLHTTGNTTNERPQIHDEPHRLDINVSGRQVDHIQKRLNSADEQGQISHIPSIPLPRNDNDIILGIGNLHSECNIVTRKPPPGGVGHHQGRLNSRINHRDFSTTRNRSHERSNSRERPDYSNNLDSLYIGHSPSSRVGFNSEFLLSATESKSSKTLQRARSKQGVKRNQSATRRTTTESDTQIVNGLFLSGNSLTSATDEQGT